MDSMNKALDAVGTLAALVEALRKPAQNEDGMITISRDEYETLLCNQTSDDIYILSQSMSDAFESNDVTLTYEERWQMVKDIAEKPAQVFLQWDYFGDGEDAGSLFFSSVIELRNTDCLRLQIPVGFTKEQVAQGLKEMSESLDRQFTVENEKAQRLAQREPPSTFVSEPLQEGQIPF